jgi:hypothetical protein
VEEIMRIWVLNLDGQRRKRKMGKEKERQEKYENGRKVQNPTKKMEFW